MNDDLLQRSMMQRVISGVAHAQDHTLDLESKQVAA